MAFEVVVQHERVGRQRVALRLRAAIVEDPVERQLDEDDRRRDEQDHDEVQPNQWAEHLFVPRGRAEQVAAAPDRLDLVRLRRRISKRRRSFRDAGIDRAVESVELDPAQLLQDVVAAQHGAGRAREISRLNSAVFRSTGSPRHVTVRFGGEIASSPGTALRARPPALPRRLAAREQQGGRRGRPARVVRSASSQSSARPSRGPRPAVDIEARGQDQHRDVGERCDARQTSMPSRFGSIVGRVFRPAGARAPATARSPRRTTVTVNS